jgi:NTE family protein
VRFFFANIIIFFFISLGSNAQKVGLVLSGGGAKGLAHIGIIKAFEENGIPIDYVVGTSMGAIVGGLYAAGYTPEQMEKIATSKEFLDWAFGKIPDKYFFYIKKKRPTPAWLELNFKYDSIIKPYLPISLVNTTPMNLAFFELFSQASQASNENFDSLMVPYRCVASDIINNKAIVFSKGNLGLAIRSSMAYPIYYAPVVVNNKILYDGGIYNNFAIDVMKKDFNPDIIIGSKTYLDKKIIDEDDLLKVVEKLVFNNNNMYDTLHNLYILEPPGLQNYGVFDFYKAREIIDLGYKYALTKIDSLKKIISIYRDTNIVTQARQNFLSKEKPFLIKNINITNLNKLQKKYVMQNHKRRKDSIISLSQFKRGYYFLMQDEQFSMLMPIAKYNKHTGVFDVNMYIKPEKHFTAKFGGNVSTGSFTTGYMELNYRFISSKSYLIKLNSYFGKFYNSVGLTSRIEMPGKIPYYFCFGIDYNRYNYFTSNTEWFFLETNPSFIIHNSTSTFGKLAIALDNKTNLLMSFHLNNDINHYYQTMYFSIDDTTDETYFPYTNTSVQINKNTLDYIQYPTKGTKSLLSVGYIWGLEHYYAGSTSLRRYKTYRVTRNWPYISFEYKKVLNFNKLLITPSFEAYFSNQPQFENFYSSSFYYKQFSPTQYSKTVFLYDFRAPSWIGAGFSIDYNIYNDIYLHINPNIFIPESKHFSENHNEVSLSPLTYYNMLFEASIVYHTKFGPLSISFNALDKTFRKQSVIINFGYIIFNEE